MAVHALTITKFTFPPLSWLVFLQLDYEKAAADLDAALTLEPTNKNAAKYRAIVAERMEGKEVRRHFEAIATDATIANDAGKSASYIILPPDGRTDTYVQMPTASHAFE